MSRFLWDPFANARSHQNHVVTLEITSGQVYRGKLIEGAYPFFLHAFSNHSLEDLDRNTKSGD